MMGQCNCHLNRDPFSWISGCWRLGVKQGGRKSCATWAPFLMLFVKIKFLPLEESKTVFPKEVPCFFCYSNYFMYILLTCHVLMDSTVISSWWTFPYDHVGQRCCLMWFIPKFQGSACALAVSIECPTHPPLQVLSMKINRSSPGSQISGIFAAFFL